MNEKQLLEAFQAHAAGFLSLLGGRLRVEGCVIKSGYKIAFMEGRIYDAAGVLTATGNSVAKVIRRQ